jgi:E1A/CREB-binding protein
MFCTLLDYFDVIKEPMDLGTILKKLNNGVYVTADEFAKEVRLTFHNAVLYNSEESEVHGLAKEYLSYFEKDYKVIQDMFNSDLKKLQCVDELSPHDNPSSCAVCMGETFHFEPQVFYCNGRCKHKIRRSHIFYSDETNKVKISLFVENTHIDLHFQMYSYISVNHAFLNYPVERVS